MEDTMKQKLGFLFLVIVALLVAEPVTIVAKCDTTSADTSESATFADDYIFMGPALNFTGEAEDLFYFGESLDFSGKTRLGIFAVGQTLRMTGSSGNGIIGGGEEIVVDGHVEGTSFFGAEKVWLRDSAVVNGDIFSGSGRLTIDGIVNGNMYVGAGQVNINSEINGNVRVYGGRIVFSPKGKINGNLIYSTKEKLSEEDKSRVSGTVKYDENKEMKEAFSAPREALQAIKIVFKLIVSFSFIVGGLLLLFLPVCKRLEGASHIETFWQSALWGLIPILMYPAVMLILFILVVTIPISGLLALAFIPLFFVAKVVGATLVGEYLATKIRFDVNKRHVHFLIGAVLYGILTMIPIIDFLTMLLYSSLGWGVFVSFLFNKKSSDKPKIAISE